MNDITASLAVKNPYLVSLKCDLMSLSTMAEISISIEINYFGSDCSILLEFSQFIDML